MFLFRVIEMNKLILRKDCINAILSLFLNKTNQRHDNKNAFRKLFDH